MSRAACIDHASTLRDALAITGNMLEAASRDDWDDVVALECERAPLIAACVGLNAEVGGLLADLHDLNRELEQLAASARTSIALALHDSRQNTAGRTAYEQNKGC